MPQIAVVAGETSGDIHAANLIAALRELRPELDVWGVGGEKMAEAGAEVILDYREFSAMGLTDVLAKLPQLSRVKKLITSQFQIRKPDLFIPVDFGGLNLKLAKIARENNIPVVYFIPPKVWAWGSGRAKKIKALVDELLVILPFEKEFWDGHGVPCTYVGSPVMDHLETRKFHPETGLVGLLPGSRGGEINSIWTPMMKVAEIISRGRDLRFMVPRVKGLDSSKMVIPPALEGRVEIVEGRAQEVMERSSLCIVASGTATLECALVGTPLVSVYFASPLTVAVGKMVMRAPFFSLPNLIAGREVVPEFLQGSPETIAAAAIPLLDETPERGELLAGLDEIKRLMGEPGASRNAAMRIIERLEVVTGGQTR